MLPFNYHHLYYFWTVAKAGSFSSASRQLLLAQSTLSLQLQQLERHFGKKLLVRQRRGVTLTPEGRIAFDYCERIFSQGQGLAAALERGAAPATAPLRLGVDEAISANVVLRLLDFVRGQSRRQRVMIVGGGLADLQERLRRRTLDLVVTNLDFSVTMGREFRSRLADSIPLFFVGTPRIRNLVGRYPAGLERVPILLRTPENPIRKEVDQFLYRRRVRVSIGAEIEDVGLLRTLTLEGRGAAALDQLSIRDDLRAGRLVKLHPKPLEARELVWLTASRLPHPDSSVQRIVQGLMDGFHLGASGKTGRK